MLFTAATQTMIGFPQSLSEKYRPRVFADFVGLERPKKMLAKFAENPYASSWLFVGPSGVGKTTMALALADAIRAEVHHIPSQKCTAGEVDDVVRRCWYAPMNGTLHVVLCDEADRMTPAAQLALLSKLDSTAAPPQTVWIFTANDTEGLQDRFLSRTRRIEFSSYGLAEETAKFLETVWDREAPNAEKPNFARIVKDSRNNVRDCLMTIETELLAA
jgi:DNA polymerase III gamma/tau subunit